MPVSLLRMLSSVTVVLVAAVGVVTAQSGDRPGYDVAFIGPPLADSVVQHAKETYVLYGCAYCHGVNLVPRGEAADLRASAIVARDVDANVIGALLRAGIPQTAKLSPMPQFSDLSDQEIRAIASWIHYARAEARFSALTTEPLPTGQAAQGGNAFDRQCRSCHSPTGDLAHVATKYDTAGLRAAMLRPRALTGQMSYRLDSLADTKTSTARQRHQSLLENFSPDEVANLLAYLAGLK